MKLFRRGACPVGTGWVIAHFPDDRWGGEPGLHASFFVKAVYRLRRDATPVAWDAGPVGGSGDVAPDGNPAHGISYPSDWVPRKPFGEFMAVGTAYGPPDAEPGGFQVRITVGKASKSLDVIGDRLWHTSMLGAHSPGPAAPVQSVPLRYDHAWGGPKYPFNPVGCGYRTAHMPNLEVPGDHAAKYSAQAQPAGFAPIPPSWPQRSEKLRGPEGRWNRHRWPWLPEQFDYSFYNAAPPDQWIAGFFTGDEALRFENMHREHAVYATRLPGVRARCFVTKHPEKDVSLPPSLCEVPLSLDTLWVDMDQEKLVLVWRGCTPVGSVKLRDIASLLVLTEPLDEPDHPPDHYAAMMTNDRVPAPAPPSAARPRPDGATLKSRLQAKAEAARREVAEAEKLAQGVITGPRMTAVRAAAPAAQKPQEFAAALEAAGREAVRRIEAVNLALAGHPSATREQLDAAGKAASLLARGLADAAQLPARIAARKAEFDARVAAAFPPSPTIDRTAFDAEAARREGFKDARLRGADFSGLDLSEVTFAGAVLRDAKFVGATLRNADLSAAILCGADLSGADLTGARLDDADLHTAVVTNTVWKGASLTHGNLSRLDLSGADFSAASGIRADFTGANLSGASFAGARLPQAMFRGAVLAGADCTGSDLRDADMSGVRAAGARLADASLSGLRAGQADFTGADFQRSTADGSIWKAATLATVCFRQASLVRARFAEATLSGTVFDRCNLSHAVFEDARMAGAILTNANLLRAAFDRADLSEASFDGANLYEAGFWDAILTSATWRGAEAAESLVARAAWVKR